MTDNTQELDEILCHFRNGTINPDPTKWAMDVADLHHAKQAILDWHNKQVEAVRRDGLLIFAAALRSVGGELTFTKAELMSTEDCTVIQYINLDGSVSYKLKETKDV